MNNKFVNVLIIVNTFFTLINSCILMNIFCKNAPVVESESIEVKTDSLDLGQLVLNKDNFMFVCDYYGIKHPEIVYAQARLESGHFTSKVFQTKNNFLGLYNSRKHEYYGFNHWSDCLKGYRDFVQVKWDGNGDYYQFLKNLPYAMDPEYINKIKVLSRS